MQNEWKKYESLIDDIFSPDPESPKLKAIQKPELMMTESNRKKEPDRERHLMTEEMIAEIVGQVASSCESVSLSSPSDAAEEVKRGWDQPVLE